MNNGIMVNPAELSSFASDLRASARTISSLLSTIQSSMAALGNSWSDAVGAEYVGKFNQFIKDSGEIATLLDKIGSDVGLKADYYASTIAKALQRMGG